MGKESKNKAKFQGISRETKGEQIKKDAFGLRRR